MRHDSANFPEKDDDGSVTIWLRKLQVGDAAAIDPIYQRYARQLGEYVQKRLRHTPLGVVDHEDVVSSVFRILVDKSTSGRLPSLSSREDLLPLLLSIAGKRTIDYIRHEKRKRGKVSEAEFQEVLLSPEDAPDALAVAYDEVHLLMEKLSEEPLKRIAALKLEDKSIGDIAEALGVSTKTISRKLKLIREIWMASIC